MNLGRAVVQGLSRILTIVVVLHCRGEENTMIVYEEHETPSLQYSNNFRKSFGKYRYEYSIRTRKQSFQIGISILLPNRFLKALSPTKYVARFLISDRGSFVNISSFVT